MGYDRLWHFSFFMKEMSLGNFHQHLTALKLFFFIIIICLKYSKGIDLLVA